MKSLIALALMFSMGNSYTQPKNAENNLDNQPKQELLQTLEKEETEEANIQVGLSFFGTRTVEAVYKHSEIKEKQELTYIMIKSDGLDLISYWNRDNDRPVLKSLLVPKEKLDGEKLENIVQEIIMEGQPSTLNNADKTFYNINGKDVDKDIMNRIYNMQGRIAENFAYMQENAVITEDGSIGFPLTEELKKQLEEEDTYFDGIMNEINKEIITPKHKK